MKASIKKCCKPLAALMAAASLTLAAPVVQAAKLKPQNLTQLIQASESIVAGSVTQVSDGFTDKGVPYTEVTIKVGSDAKGKHKKGTDYTFRQFGLLKPRTMANGHKMLAVSPEGFPNWHEGEYVVAFMHEKAKTTGLQTTAGMAQGKFNLVNGKVSTQFNNVGLFEGVQLKRAQLSAEQQEMLTQGGAVDANDFMDLIQKAIAQGSVSNGEIK